jgi:phosphatidate cytidylyltransferase
MLAKRLLSIAILVPLLIASVYFGGWWLTAFVGIFVGIAAWEYGQLFKSGNYNPSDILLIAGCVSLIVARQLFNSNGMLAVIALLVLSGMVWHTIAYQRGIQTAATDFVITLAGCLYLGFLASFILAIRLLPDGLFWLLLVLPSIAFADGGAYFVGRALGKHRMMDKVSPKKSWEGYIGGVIIACILTPLLALWFRHWAPSFTWQKGLLLGAVLGILAPLGDFGESMLKRQFNLKDSSQLIPGHGGFLDRVDSFLFAAVLGYYLIVWFFI